MTKQKQRVVVRVQKKELHAKAHKRAIKKWDKAMSEKFAWLYHDNKKEVVPLDDSDIELWNKKIDILVERLALIRREDVVNFI